jgi:hypothetical protein
MSHARWGIPTNGGDVDWRGRAKRAIFPGFRHGEFKPVSGLSCQMFSLSKQVILSLHARTNTANHALETPDQEAGTYADDAM